MQCIKITHTNKNITIRVIKNTIKVREGRIVIKKIEVDRSWKDEDKEYLRELQSFFDKADNILDEDLKKKIIEQMLRCDYILTRIAENRFNEFYKLGYKKAKGE